MSYIIDVGVNAQTCSSPNTYRNHMICLFDVGPYVFHSFLIYVSTLNRLPRQRRRRRRQQRRQRMKTNPRRNHIIKTMKNPIRFSQVIRHYVISLLNKNGNNLNN